MYFHSQPSDIQEGNQLEEDAVLGVECTQTHLKNCAGAASDKQNSAM